MRSLAIVAVLCAGSVVGAADHSIRVSARSAIKVDPNEVLLELVVHTRDASLLVSKRRNDERAAAVLALAPRHGIPAVDVKVAGLTVSPDWDYEAARRETPRYYDFDRVIEVRLTDFSKIEPFLTDAFEAGITHVTNLHFRLENQREHQFAARRLAVEYAREKADHLAELTDMKVGAPLRIEEDVETNWDAGGFGGFGGRAEVTPGRRRLEFTALQGKDGTETQPAEGAGIEKVLAPPGQIVITANVTIEYEMTP